MTKKPLLLLLALGIAALLGFRLYEQLAADGGGGARGPGGAATRVETTTVREMPLRDTIVAVGALRARERVDVTAKVGGRLLERLVDLGDTVQAGEVVARLDDDEIRQQVQQADASLSVSRAVVQQREAEAENARIDLERARGLAETELISAQEFEQVQTRYDVALSQVNVAAAQVEQAEASLEELRIRLDQTRVTAPIDGVVGRRFVDAGALLNANSPIVTLLNLDSVILVTNVAERQLTRLSVGDLARVTVDALPDEEFSGEVVRISPLLDGQTRTGQVELHVANVSGHLKAEMFARATIELGTRRLAAVVPRGALVYRGDQTGTYLVENGVARFRPVETGASENEMVEIRDGLRPGDVVVTLGANLVRDGDAVEVAGASPGAGTEETDR